MALRAQVATNKGYKMTLDELIEIADRVYPDGFIKLYYVEPDPSGDTLAKFIVTEIKETYDAKASDDKQLETLIRALESGRRELGNVTDALWAKREEEGAPRELPTRTRGMTADVPPPRKKRGK